MSDSHTAMTASREARAWSTSGYLMLLLFLALLVFTVFRIVTFAGGPDDGADAFGFAVSVALSVVALILISSGFYMIQPNQAAAITLFGSYKGTDRTEGLRWVLPWLTRSKIAVRANNVISEKIKVNDARGNPIEMAAQVVWRVTDTAQALYDVDDYKAFVVVQIEAAVRTIGSRYPYDDFAHAEVTLRGNHDEVGAELRNELIARLQMAGITSSTPNPPGGQIVHNADGSPSGVLVDTAQGHGFEKHLTKAAALVHQGRAHRMGAHIQGEPDRLHSATAARKVL